MKIGKRQKNKVENKKLEFSEVDDITLYYDVIFASLGHCRWNCLPFTTPVNSFFSHFSLFLCTSQLALIGRLPHNDTPLIHGNETWS
jgi:hypothetical protein